MGFRCNLTAEEQRTVLEFFESEQIPDVWDSITASFPQYIFTEPASLYDDIFLGEASGKQDLHCTCTWPGCGSFFSSPSYDVYADNFVHQQKHGTKIPCPQCGHDVTIKRLGKFRSLSSLEDRKVVVIFQRAPDAGLMARAGQVRRQYNYNDLTADPWFLEYKRYYFRDRKCCMWKADSSEYYLYHRLKWMPTKTIGEPVNESSGAPHYKHGEYALFNVDAIRETSSGYACADRFFGLQLDDAYGDPETTWGLMAYFSAYCHKPAIERLMKLGLRRPVKELLETGSTNRNDLNWESETVWGMLKISKATYRALLKENLLTWDAIRLLHKGELAEDELCGLVRRCRTVQGVQKLMDCAKFLKISLREAENYIKRQAGVDNYRDRPGIWLDYLLAAKRHGMDTAVKGVRFPQNLIEAHDNLTAMEKLGKGGVYLEERKEKLAKMYDFAYGGLVAIAPRTLDDIVTEGTRLHHCVGDYAARHGQGALDIVFIRKERTPGRSFITAEFAHRAGPKSDVCIRQIYRFHNDRTLGFKSFKTSTREKYAWFLNVYTNWLAKGSPRDKSGRPIITAAMQTA